MENNRRTGRTTRLVDLYVQEYFNSDEFNIEDHHKGKNSTEDLLEIFMQRLRIEHRILLGVHYNIVNKGVTKRIVKIYG